jgi:hypothetical protein
MKKEKMAVPTWLVKHLGLETEKHAREGLGSVTEKATYGKAFNRRHGHGG